MTRQNLKLILNLNQSLPITQRPFRAMAKRLNINEEKLLSILKDYKKTALIRRFGAVLSHQKIGFKTNVLIAWQVEKKSINAVAKIFSKFPQISHAYLRISYPHWPYNLYTMLHLPDRKTVFPFIKMLSRKIKVEDFRILFTLKEFKKTRLILGRSFCA